jgi:hypothetical protein
MSDILQCSVPACARLHVYVSAAYLEGKPFLATQQHRLNDSEQCQRPLMLLMLLSGTMDALAAACRHVTAVMRSHQQPLMQQQPAQEAEHRRRPMGKAQLQRARILQAACMLAGFFCSVVQTWPAPIVTAKAFEQVLPAVAALVVATQKETQALEAAPSQVIGQACLLKRSTQQVVNTAVIIVIQLAGNKGEGSPWLARFIVSSDVLQLLMVSAAATVQLHHQHVQRSVPANASSSRLQASRASSASSSTSGCAAAVPAPHEQLLQELGLQCSHLDSLSGWCIDWDSVVTIAAREVLKKVTQQARADLLQRGTTSSSDAASPERSDSPSEAATEGVDAASTLRSCLRQQQHICSKPRLVLLLLRVLGQLAALSPTCPDIVRNVLQSYACTMCLVTTGPAHAWRWEPTAAEVMADCMLTLLGPAV